MRRLTILFTFFVAFAIFVQANVRIGVLLPLCGDNKESNLCVEFYRGLLMAAEELKEQGSDITIFAFDEGTAASSIDFQLNQLALASCQVVITPLYPQHVDAVAQWARQHSDVHIVVPFKCNFPQIQSLPNILALKASQTVEDYLANELIAEVAPPSSSHIVRIFTPSGDLSDKANTVINAMVSKGATTASVPSTAVSADIINALRGNRHNVFVFDGGNGKEITEIINNKILPTITQCQNLSYSTIAWQEWLNSEASFNFFAMNSYYVSPTFYNTYSSVTKSLEERYKAYFHVDPFKRQPRLYLQGYDLAYYLVHGLQTWKSDFPAHEVNAPYLQTQFRFVRSNQQSGWTNTCLWLVHYAPNGAVELKSKK